MEKYCLILGAKSAMARAIAHSFAAKGYNIYLAARKASEVEADASDITIRFKVKAIPVVFDAVAFGTHQASWDTLSPKPEVVVCAVGYMPDQKEAEKDSSLALAAMQTNYTGVAHYLNIAANYMEAQRKGDIIGISSVAGDRGRASNYFYGSAKAGFTAFLSGLRNRLSFAGVHVLTVKPGFVYTKMTEGLKLSPLLTAKPEEVAKDVMKAFRKKKNVLYTKWMWKYIMKIIRSVPEWKFKKMKL